MKRILICPAVAWWFAGASFAQTKTMTGTVIDYSQGNKGNWDGIRIKVGIQIYFVYITSMDYPAAKTVGTINRAGRVVQVFYTKNVSNSGDYAGAIIAAKIVEVKRSQPQKIYKNKFNRTGGNNRAEPNRS